MTVAMGKVLFIKEEIVPEFYFMFARTSVIGTSSETAEKHREQDVEVCERDQPGCGTKNLQSAFNVYLISLTPISVFRPRFHWIGLPTNQI